VTGSALGARRSAGATATATVRHEVANGVARITLDRAPVNVLNLSLLEELARVLGDVRGAANVHCVLLEGSGKAFCAGVDVADHTPDRVERMLTLFQEVIDALLALPVPVICAVQGVALGGGMELAIACDVILAREDAIFGQPEIRLGVFPPAAAAILPALIGRQRALDLIISGRAVTAAEAQAMGMVSATVPIADFARRVDDYVSQLASLSAPVLRLAKRAVTEGLGLGADAALANAERLYLEELMALEDPQEGLAAWIAKRTPKWRNT